MLTRTEFADIAGKTVGTTLGRLGNDQQLVVIVFDDDTYIAIDIERGWEGEVSLIEGDIDMDSFPRASMIAAGLYTQEDYDRSDAQKVAIRMLLTEKKRAEELRTLAILKEKYPDP